MEFEIEKQDGSKNTVTLPANLNARTGQKMMTKMRARFKGDSAGQGSLEIDNLGKYYGDVMDVLVEEVLPGEYTMDNITFGTAKRLLGKYEDQLESLKKKDIAELRQSIRHNTEPRQHDLKVALHNLQMAEYGYPEPKENMTFRQWRATKAAMRIADEEQHRQRQRAKAKARR